MNHSTKDETAIVTPFVSQWTVTTAAGVGRAPFQVALTTGDSLLRPNDFTRTPLSGWIGRINGLENAILPAKLQAMDSRVGRLAWLALQADLFAEKVSEAVERYGATRVALVLGTSSSSIGETEAAYRDFSAHGVCNIPGSRPEVHTLHAPAIVVQRALGLAGLSLTVSTACSSSAQAFGVARQWLAADLADAVVVGGIDVLCESVLYGFAALQLISADPCRPFDTERAGISLGEAAGFALLERSSTAARSRLLGIGESSDAYHMSSPHPEGRGARQAMAAALLDAGVAPAEIDFWHLHGTGTRLNDATEAQALMDVTIGVEPTHAVSTKGAFGHTLGAAGFLGAAACWLALETSWRCGTAGLHTPDPSLGFTPVASGYAAPTRIALANAFGFGGTNASLVFGHV